MTTDKLAQLWEDNENIQAVVNREEEIMNRLLELLHESGKCYELATNEFSVEMEKITKEIKSLTAELELLKNILDEESRIINNKLASESLEDDFNAT